MSAAIAESALLARVREPLERRTFDRVRKGALGYGEGWEEPWRRLQDRQQGQTLLRGLRAYYSHAREERRRTTGRLGRRADKLEQLLALIVHFKTTTGVFDMTALAISQAIECGLSTVYRLIARLRDLGLIEWQTRSKEIGPRQHGRPGLERAQTSSIFRLRRLPERLLAILKARSKPKPVPEDAEAWEARKAAQVEDMRRQAHKIALDDQAAASPSIRAAQAKGERARMADTALFGPVSPRLSE